MPVAMARAWLLLLLINLGTTTAKPKAKKKQKGPKYVLKQIPEKPEFRNLAVFVSESYTKDGESMVDDSLEETFKVADKNNDGLIDLQEMYVPPGFFTDDSLLIPSMNPKLKRRSAKETVDQYAKKRKGRLTLREFYRYWKGISYEQVEDDEDFKDEEIGTDCRLDFVRVDKDKNDLMETEELGEYIQHRYQVMFAERIIEIADDDLDGNISFEDLKRARLVLKKTADLMAGGGDPLAGEGAPTEDAPNIEL